MNQKNLLIQISSPILPIVLTIMEIRSNDPFSWVLVGVSWFVVISLIFVLYVSERIGEINKLKERISHLEKEVDLNNKIVSLYNHIENVKKSKRSN